jgi:hypothetical protein
VRVRFRPVATRRNAQRRRRNVDADPPAQTWQLLQRKSVVYLGRRRIVYRKCPHLGPRQTARQTWQLDCRESRAVRELFEQEALQVVVVGRADGATPFEQVCGRQARLAARRFKRLGLAAVAIGSIEQLTEQRRKLGWQRKCLELGNHAFDGQGLLPLLLQTGECRLEDVGRGLAEAALALAMEVDGCRMQGQQQRCRFDRRGGVTKVFVGHIGEGKLPVSHAFPEKISLDPGRQDFGLIKQQRWRRFTVAQEDVCRLDLAAFAGGRLDLQGAVVVGDQGGRLEGPVFFE